MNPALLVGGGSGFIGGLIMIYLPYFVKSMGVETVTDQVLALNSWGFSVCIVSVVLFIMGLVVPKPHNK